MLVAHRNGMAVSGWTNPYVTDGLVAMWDGIWNVGGGQPHDSDSLIWWDCILGYPICSQWGTVVFSANGLVVSNGVYGGAYGNGQLSDFGFRSIEIVAGISAAQTSVIVCIGGRTVSVNAADSGIGFFRSGNYQTHAGVDMSAFSAYADYGNSMNYNASEVLIDAQTASSMSSDTWIRNDGIGYGRIKSGYDVQNQYQFSGTIHAIRLYSRALTAAEIAANYAIDKARFNLP